MAIRSFNAELIPKIRKLDVYARQSVLSQVIEGNWATSFKGHGLEFSGYRAYTFSDDASMIDWKASLRSKSMLVKDYEQERSVNIYFLVDVSNSMLFTSTKKLKAEYAAELVSSLAFAILRTGDAVGMGLFTNKIVNKVPINVGRRMHYIMVRELGNVNNYGGPFDLNNALKIVLSVLSTKAVIIIVSDFIGLKPEWYRYLRIAAKQYEVIGIMIRDPRDRELPKQEGQYYLEDPYTGEKMLVDVEQYAKSYKEFVEKEEEDIEKQFKATKSEFLKITTDKNFYEDVIKFFKRRALTHRNN